MNVSIRMPRHWLGAKELGKGTFSVVYSAYDTESGVEIAIKVPRDSMSEKLLEREAEILHALKTCKSVPQILDSSAPPAFIAMEKVGKTLLSLHTELTHMSLKTVLMVAVRAITALEDIHSYGFLHKDVKPDNIAVGAKRTDPRIFFIDMGLSCRFQSNGSHISYTEDNNFQGTPYFCSINSLRGVRTSRRDDLEALGYILVFLCLGSLPWTDNCAFNSLSDILAYREKIAPNELCAGLDHEFAVYLNKCQSYNFTEKPDYDELRSLFTSLAARKNLTLDWKYDWFPRLKSARSQGSSALTLSSGSKGVCRRASTRMKMLELELETQFPHPSYSVEKQSRRASQPVSFCLEETPVHRIDQLPSFHRRLERIDLLQETCDIGVFSDNASEG